MSLNFKRLKMARVKRNQKTDLSDSNEQATRRSERLKNKQAAAKDSKTEEKSVPVTPSLLARLRDRLSFNFSFRASPVSFLAAAVVGVSLFATGFAAMGAAIASAAGAFFAVEGVRKGRSLYAASLLKADQDKPAHEEAKEEVSAEADNEIDLEASSDLESDAEANSDIDVGVLQEEDAKNDPAPAAVVDYREMGREGQKTWGAYMSAMRHVKTMVPGTQAAKDYQLGRAEAEAEQKPSCCKPN
jgi:hypothetical protein